MESVSKHYMVLKSNFEVIFGNIYDCFVFFLWKNGKNLEKLPIKTAKMCQNRHQGLFGVISFHAGVYFGKKTTKI